MNSLFTYNTRVNKMKQINGKIIYLGIIIDIKI